MSEWHELALLWLVNSGYLLFLIYDICWLDYRYGRTVLSIALRRRNIWDRLALLGVLFAAIYYAALSGGRALLYGLLALLVLVVVEGARPRLWRLKEKGFIGGGRFIRYRDITAIKLAEDGTLRLFLRKRGYLDFAVRDMAALEQAAIFLTGFDDIEREARP